MIGLRGWLRGKTVAANFLPHSKDVFICVGEEGAILSSLNEEL